MGRVPGMPEEALAVHVSNQREREVRSLPQEEAAGEAGGRPANPRDPGIGWICRATPEAHPLVSPRSGMAHRLLQEPDPQGAPVGANPRLPQTRERHRKHLQARGSVHDPTPHAGRPAGALGAGHVRRTGIQDVAAPGAGARHGRTSQHRLGGGQRCRHQTVQLAHPPDQAHELALPGGHQPRSPILSHGQAYDRCRPGAPAVRSHPVRRPLQRRWDHEESSRPVAEVDPGIRQRPAPASAEDRQESRAAAEGGGTPGVLHLLLEPGGERGGGRRPVEALRGSVAVGGHEPVLCAPETPSGPGYVEGAGKACGFQVV
mmetsp:Transcript_7401/g.26332  ORF Transcript_7401/g.26332 Transcript_7401/m.26332 type:complete len:317 (-) Transcript_7401:559-1509(-)